MEPTSLALGIPGFIAVALQTYSSVVRSINSYRNLPREVENIIIAITREETLFARHVDLLLETYMAEIERTELVKSRGSAPEYSQFHAQICSWEGRFHKLEQELTEQRKVKDQDGLGTEADVDPDEFRTILFEMELIKDVGITLDAIKEIRSKYLKQQEIEVVEASKPRDGHMEAVDSVVALTLRRRLNSALTRSIKRKPPRARLTPNKSNLFFHDVAFKLREQLEQLGIQNRRLNDTLNQRAAWNKIAPPRSILPYALTRTTDPPGQRSNTPLSAHCTTRTFSSKLYKELSEHCVCCEKHDLYLCLHIQPGKEIVAADGDVGLLVDFDHEPTVRFTALVTTKLPTTVTVATQEIGLKCLEITDCKDRSAFLEIQDVPTDDREVSRCPRNLCEDIFSTPACHRVYFLNTFHLRSHRRLPLSCSRPPNPRSAAFDLSVITLRQLVLPESRSPWYRCDPYGLLLIAAGLVNAAPSFHSSPWARSWSTRSITYFRNLEISDDIETWKPYIAGSFAKNDPLPCNTILRALSILLAEVAGVDMDMGIGEYLHDPVPGKIRNISRGLGKQYGDIVKRLYKVYQTSLWEDDVSMDGKIDNLCLEIAQELYDMAKKF